MAIDPPTLDLLTRFSAGRISAIEVRKRLDDATYGDLLRLLADAGLSLPPSDPTGREQDLAKARAWMFPDHAA